MSKIVNHFRTTVDFLSSAGIDSPRLEARMMLAEILQLVPELIETNIILSDEQAQQLQSMIERRQQHEPLDKILGYRDFYKHRFIVDQNVLSPRPDSETLVEAAIEITRKENTKSILEFGVGSGCLILSILSEFPHMYGLGLDKSIDALHIAAQNAQRLNIEQQISLQCIDYFHDELPKQKFSMIISNPPYIPTTDIPSLDKEVRLFDPLLALDGGEDGYLHYRRLASIIPSLLTDNGKALLEIGIGQADTVCSIFNNHGLNTVAKIKDLSGIDRCIIFKK